MPAHRSIRIAALISLHFAAFEGLASAEERAAPPASIDTSAESKPAEQAKRESLRIGPLLGLSFPRPLVVGALAKIHRTVGIGAEYGFMPRTTFGSTAVEFKGIAADLRVFPFQGAFFVGVRGGRQWLDGVTTLSAAQLGSLTESASASTWFVNPRIGFLKTWESGISVGIDAGVQIPIQPTFQRSGVAASAGVTSGVDDALLTVASALGNATTPTIDLLRLGFLF